MKLTELKRDHFLKSVLQERMMNKKKGQNGINPELGLSIPVGRIYNFKALNHRTKRVDATRCYCCYYLRIIHPK